MDGGSFFGTDHEIHHANYASETDYDESRSCRPAFQVLKQLVQRCISDAVSSNNIFADAILQHIYRWICRSKLTFSYFH